MVMLNIVGILLGCGLIGLILILGLAAFYAVIAKLVVWFFSKLMGDKPNKGQQ